MNGDHATDFNDWLGRTARLIRERRWQEVDAEQLADEVEDLGKSERRGIASQLTRLLVHLLKWRHQPERRSDGWQDSIADSRLQIQLAIEDSPSLRDYLAQQLDPCYRRARRAVAKQTGLPLRVFPETCPFPPQDVLSEDWLPM